MILPVQMILNDIRTSTNSNRNNERKQKKLAKDIMSSPTGTRIRCKSNKYTYILGDYVSDNSRRLISENGFVVDYINHDNQNEYEIIE